MIASSRANDQGLVRPWERNRSFVLEARPPSRALDRLIDRHWIVRWDLRGRTGFSQEILPHPSINLVVERPSVRVWGVPTRLTVRMLHGRGWAVGVKLKLGAFTAVTGIAADTLTNRSIETPACLGGAQGFGPVGDLDEAEADAVVGALEERLAPHTDVCDPALDLVNAVLHTMRDLTPNVRVEEIAAKHGVAPRTLQRLFRHYVGVSPKWVLKRLRIHQAIELLARSPSTPWTSLALALGYYDHAHLIRDFRIILGRSPAEYVLEASEAAKRGRRHTR